MGDSGTGMQAGMAILAAYIQRLRTGQGQKIELSMQEAMTYYMRTRIALLADWGNQAAPRLGNRMGTLPTELYPCLGGGPNDYIYLITVTARHWDALCLAIGRVDLIGRAAGAAVVDEIALEFSRRFGAVNGLRERRRSKQGHDPQHAQGAENHSVTQVESRCHGRPLDGSRWPAKVSAATMYT